MATVLRPPLVFAAQPKAPIGTPDPPVYPLTLGIPPAATPKVMQLWQSAPHQVRWVEVDVIPNLLGTTLRASSNLIPIVQSFGSAPLPLVSRVHADVYPNLLENTLQPPVAPLTLPLLAVRWDANAPRTKHPVQVDITPNPVILRPVPKVRQLFDGVTPPKYAVQVDVYPNILVKGINPNAQVQGLTASAPPPKFAVQVDVYPNLALSTLVSFVTVPSVLGDSQATATAVLSGVGLNASVTYFYSAVATADIVIDQSPLAGAHVALGSAVSITVTRNTIAMPNVVGENFYEALQILQDAGIYLPLVPYAFAASQIAVTWTKTTQPPGIVTAQSIAAGAGVKPGQSIALTVSSFPMASMIDMPPDWSQ